MMKSTFITLAKSLIMFGIILTGCRNPVINQAAMDNPVLFDTILTSERYHLLGDSTNPYCSLESSFIYPSDYPDKEMLQQLQKHFLTSFFGEDNASSDPQTAMDSYAKKYVNSYKELEQEPALFSPESRQNTLVESMFTYYEISSNEIHFNQYNLLSYSDFIEFYTGGAHGKHAYNNHVLSLLTGEPLNEQDIFIDGFQDELAEIIVHFIAKDHEATLPEELENMGYFNVKEIYPNNNFYVDADGITYTYNEYEIAAYYIGKTDVLLPFEAIRHLIREDSPVTPLALFKK